MARKNLLQGLLGNSVSVPAENAVSPRMARGAIGAISRSVAELQARALMEIDAELIDAGGVHDRLEADPAKMQRCRRRLRNMASRCRCWCDRIQRSRGGIRSFMAGAVWRRSGH